MELLLWRWSTAVQVTSLLMITAFFVVLSRSLRRPALRIWNLAWILNLTSLAVALSFWYFGLDRFGVVVRPVYMGAKTVFVLLLLQGGLVMQSRHKSPRVHPSSLPPLFSMPSQRPSSFKPSTSSA